MLSHGVYIYAVLVDTPKEFLTVGVAIDPPSSSVSYSFSTSLPTLGIASVPHFSHSYGWSVALYSVFFIYTFLITG